MFPSSFVGEEVNLPRLLLPVLSGKEKEKGSEDTVTNDHDAGLEYSSETASANMHESPHYQKRKGERRAGEGRDEGREEKRGENQRRETVIQTKDASTQPRRGR